MDNTFSTVRQIKESNGNMYVRLAPNPWWANIIIYSLLFIGGIITLIPLWTVLMRSVSPSHIIVQYPILIWPKEFTFQAYIYILKTSTLIRSFGITVYITVVGTALSMICTILAAYGLSKTNLPGNRILMNLVVIAMLFHAGIIPTYLVVRQLGLIDSLWALILPVLISPFNLILMRNYFWSIPAEMEDSAKIDGASVFRTLWSILIPLSLPAIATISLFYAVAQWNNFFTALFYINDNTKWPLQLLLRSIIMDNSMRGMGSLQDTIEVRRIVNPENIRAAVIVFVTVPILFVYPFIQKYFVQGIMIGAIKG